MNLFRIINKKGTSADAIFLTLVKLLSSLIAMVNIKIISINFSLEEFGTYSQAILIISTVSSITILGMSDGVNYFYNKDNLSLQDRLTSISTLFASQCLVGITSAIMILISGHALIDYFQNPRLGAVFIWIAFQPLLNNFLPMLQCLYISVGKTKLIVYRNLLLSIFRLCVFLYACYITKSIVTILAFCFIFDLLQTIYFWFTIKKNGVRISFRNTDLRILGNLLKYCIPVALYIILNSLTRDIDKWLVGYLGNTEELAIYANCSRVLPFDMLTSSFAIVLTPIITRYIFSKREIVKDLLSTYLNFSLIITAILVLPAIILSKDLLLTLYAHEYLPGLCIFKIYLMVDMLRFTNITILFSSSGKPKFLIYISVIAIISNTILAFILYFLIGFNGPAIATFITFLISGILMFIGGSQILGTNIFKLLNYQKFLRVLIEVAILSISYIAFEYIYPDINPIIRFLVFYILFIGCLGIFNRGILIMQLKKLNQFKLRM